MPRNHEEDVSFGSQRSASTRTMGDGSGRFEEGSVERFLRQAHTQAEKDLIKQQQQQQQQQQYSQPEGGITTTTTTSSALSMPGAYHQGGGAWGGGGSSELIDGIPVSEFLAKAHAEQQISSEYIEGEGSPQIPPQLQQRYSYQQYYNSQDDVEITHLGMEPPPLRPAQGDLEFPDQPVLSAEVTRTIHHPHYIHDNRNESSLEEGQQTTTTTTASVNAIHHNNNDDHGTHPSSHVSVSTLHEEGDDKNCSNFWIVLCVGVTLSILLGILGAVLVIFLVGDRPNGDDVGGPVPTLSPHTSPPVPQAAPESGLSLAALLGPFRPFATMIDLARETLVFSTVLNDTSLSLTLLALDGRAIERGLDQNASSEVLARVLASSNDTVWFAHARLLMLNHILPEEFVTSRDTSAVQFVNRFTALSGSQMAITRGTDGRFIITQDDIFVADVEAPDTLNADNGIVHRVTMPIIPSTMMHTLVEEMNTTSDFSTFYEYLQMSGLEGSLNHTGPQTVLVPTNQAFAIVSQDVHDVWRTNTTALRDMVSRHILEGENLAVVTLFQKYLEESGESTASLTFQAQPLAGGDQLLQITVSNSNGPITAVVNNGEALIVGTAIIVANGVLQGLDRVLGMK